MHEKLHAPHLSPLISERVGAIFLNVAMEDPV